MWIKFLFYIIVLHIDELKYYMYYVKNFAESGLNAYWNQYFFILSFYFTLLYSILMNWNITCIMWNILLKMV